jgi:predicted DNA-binding protein
VYLPCNVKKAQGISHFPVGFGVPCVWNPNRFSNPFSQELNKRLKRLELSKKTAQTKFRLMFSKEDVEAYLSLVSLFTLLPNHVPMPLSVYGTPGYGAQQKDPSEQLGPIGQYPTSTVYPPAACSAPSFSLFCSSLLRSAPPRVQKYV